MAALVSQRVGRALTVSTEQVTLYVEAKARITFMKALHVAAMYVAALPRRTAAAPALQQCFLLWH